MGVTDKEKKRQVRIEIMNLMDTHCKGCTKQPYRPSKTYGKDSRWCGKHCEIGKELLDLGKQTEKRQTLQTKSFRTFLYSKQS